jgi:hypothetical protein
VEFSPSRRGRMLAHFMRVSSIGFMVRVTPGVTHFDPPKIISVRRHTSQSVDGKHYFRRTTRENVTLFEEKGITIRSKYERSKEGA